YLVEVISFRRDLGCEAMRPQRRRDHEDNQHYQQHIDQRRYVYEGFILGHGISRHCSLPPVQRIQYSLRHGEDEDLPPLGVRRPVGALVAGDLWPAASRQVATDQSGDTSPHSKKISFVQTTVERTVLEASGLLLWPGRLQAEAL